MYIFVWPKVIFTIGKLDGYTTGFIPLESVLNLAVGQNGVGFTTFLGRCPILR